MQVHVSNLDLKKAGVDVLAECLADLTQSKRMYIFKRLGRM